MIKPKTLTKQTKLEPRDSDTEQKILTAARRVFIRRGAAGARMQEIAEEAGVNKALLHYYFRSKDRLAQTVFREVASRLAPEIITVLSGDASLETKIEQLIHLYIDNVRQTPFIPAYIIAEIHQHPERVAALLEYARVTPADIQRALGGFAAQLDAAAAAGTIRPIAPLQFLTNLIGLIIMPFLTRPMMQVALDMDDDAFRKFLDARRVELPAFVLSALRP